MVKPKVSLEEKVDDVVDAPLSRVLDGRAVHEAQAKERVQLTGAVFQALVRLSVRVEVILQSHGILIRRFLSSLLVGVDGKDSHVLGGDIEAWYCPGTEPRNAIASTENRCKFFPCFIHFGF